MNEAQSTSETAGSSVHLYVSCQGNDRWSGTLAEPNDDGTDGPFATIVRARDAIRGRTADAETAGASMPGASASVTPMSGANRTAPMTVWIRGGYYFIPEAIEFTPLDSGPVAYRAFPGETPVISGGRRIAGWRTERMGERDVWVADVPDVAAGAAYFRQLFVGGKRRRRATFPKEGYFWMKSVPGIDVQNKQLTDDMFSGSDTFVCFDGDIGPWRNMTDVDIVAFHYWVEERMPMLSFDERTNTVKTSRNSRFALKDDVAKRYAKYVAENVFEALSEPGEWYLDRQLGKVYYIPLPGETVDGIEAFAGIAGQLLKLTGQPHEQRYVEHIRLEGLHFRHNEWTQPTGRGIGLFDNSNVPFEDGADYAADAQGACSVPGAIQLTGARHCTIEDCVLANLGTYGIDISSGCTDIRIIGNTLTDLGAGGIKMNGAAADGPPHERTGNNHITDNHIHDGGHVFHSAVGILSVHSFGNRIDHNHIHDLYYSGISCGWVWGYGANISQNNMIEYNDIHDLGKGLLSDMGGIYTLGVQPGTVIRGNRIRDIEKCNYGGWAIYLDEGSSHIVVEHNVCYRTSSTVFNQHYGRENIVRNNVFAYGREGQVSLGRAEPHRSFTLANNIVVSQGQPLYVGGRRGQLERRGFAGDLNVLWDAERSEPVSGNGSFDAEARHVLTETFTLEQLREWGYDAHSVVADPGIGDLATGTFAWAALPPASVVGFVPPDPASVGPRSREQRELPK